MNVPQMFVENAPLNCMLQFQFDRLMVPLERNSSDLLYDVVMLFCRIAVACGRKTFWPGRDVRLAVINHCYSYVYRPLKGLRVSNYRLHTEFGRDLGETHLDDVRRRICLVYETRLYIPTQPKTFYSNVLDALNLSWMLEFFEWKQMWRLLQGKRPRKSTFSITSTGAYDATSFEIVDEPENRGFSIIQMHWKPRRSDNVKFDVEILLDVVLPTEDIYETTKALHAAIATRYPGAIFFIDCKTSQAPTYRALGYTEVPSLSAEMGKAYGSEHDFQAFVSQSKK